MTYLRITDDVLYSVVALMRKKRFWINNNY